LGIRAPVPNLCLMRSRRSTRATLLAVASALFALLLLLASAGPASAGNGGVGPPDANGDGHKKKKKKKGDATGASLRTLTTRPGIAFFDARHKSRFEFELRGTRRRDLVVTAIRIADAAPVKSWQLTDVKPGAEPMIRWAGWTDDGLLTRQGKYQFVVSNADGTPADTSRAEGEPIVGFYGHKFPVRGEHSYGDGLGAGRHHRGFDIPAECGTPIVAARGGIVQWRKFQRGGAGHYLVIDGRRTGLDYAYMHLRERSPLQKGDRVRTGQLIGYMGSTGHSTGCHLHLEVWSAPGWGAGGDFLDAEAMAKRWDRWS
jgi:murein DD-endopeptidase MepM/ murein hydrolase activator NlpD